MALLRNRPCLHLRSCTRPSVLQLPRPATCFQTVSAPAPVAQAPARTKQCPADRGALSICRAGLLGGSDVVADYTKELTEEIHDLAEEVKDFVPEKADEVLSAEEQGKIKDYISRATDLLLLEVDAEVQEFVCCLKDWPLKWLQHDGRVLTGLSAVPAGDYYQQEVVRFYMPAGSTSKRNSSSSSDADEQWADLPRHSMSPGDTMLLTAGKEGPLANMGWRGDMLCGVVIERTKTSIKVAFETAPEKDELDCNTWRLDKSVNTLTVKRALLALITLWHRMPLNPETWFNKTARKLGLPSATRPHTFKEDIDRFMESFDADSGNPRQHRGIFEGSALSGVIVTADQGFDWGSLPARAGGIPDSAISSLSKVLPSGRPDEAATAAYLREREQTGDLGQHGRFLLDASQLQAIATAVLNPLSLLHGPPGTGKTTTIGGLLFFLRKRYGYKGRILATAQSNVAVDNMLETAMRRGGLRVLRIGEPAKVRSCLQAFTLKAQLARAVALDPEVLDAKSEQQSLRRMLRNSRMLNGEYLERWEKRQIFERLDELKEQIEAATAIICKGLLDSADVVGVTCTGAAGPELQHFAFDMVVIDEGSQASEPEALIPIMKGSQRVVLVGDHKQLPPVIKSREAEEGGLGKSLFERLMRLGAPSAMLQVQYRSHPALMNFINEQFYSSLLSNGVSAAARPIPCGFPFPNPQVPLVFIHVDGKESSSARGSKMNEKEAAVLEDCVRYLVERCKLQPGQLGVITPYAAQVALLGKRLQKQGFNVNGSGRSSSWDSQDDEYVSTDLEIRSVDGYQGREKDVILLSTVRANNNQEVGFLEDWRRANVALSRARTALVVVGHRSTLKSSKTWNAFLNHVQERDCLVQLHQMGQVLSSSVNSSSI